MAHLFKNSKADYLEIKHTNPDDFLVLSNNTLSTRLPITKLGKRVVYFSSFVVDQPDAPIKGEKLPISKLINKDQRIVFGYFYEKENPNNWWTLVGNPQQFDGKFNLLNPKGSPGTTARTDCKETVSEIVFLNGKISEQQVKQLLAEFPDPNSIKMVDVYDSIYYENAIAQFNAFVKFLGSRSPSQYIAERRGSLSKYNRVFYESVRRFVSNYDNWNPGDVWFFDKQYIRSQYYEDIDLIKQSPDDKNLVQVVNKIVSERLKEKKIIPVSLKQASSLNYKVKKISFQDKYLVNSYLKNDYGLDTVTLSDAFANLTLITKCGFKIRVGRKGSGNSKGLAFEGSIKGSGHQLGAIDKSVIKTMYNIVDGKSVNGKIFTESSHDQSLLKSILTDLFQLTGRVKNNRQFRSGKSGIQHYVDAYNKLDNYQKQYGYILLTAIEKMIQNWYSKEAMKDDIRIMHMLAEKVSPTTCDHIKVDI